MTHPWPGEPQLLADLGVLLPRERVPDRAATPPSRRRAASDGKLRTRRTREARLDVSNLDMLLEVCKSKYFADLVSWIASHEPERGPGRRPTTNPASVATMLALSAWLDNERDAHRQLGHQSSWRWLRKAMKRAWPDRPDLRLPAHRPSRDAHRRGVAQLPERELAAQLQRTVEDHAFETANRLFPKNPRAITDPRHENVLSGDATFLRSRTDHVPGSHGVRADGTLFPHLADPQARSLRKKLKEIPTDRYKAPTDSSRRVPRATPFTFVSARLPEGNERVLFGIIPVPEGKSDASVFTDYLLENRERLSDFTVANYDMALRGTDNQRLLGTGYIPMVKVPRAKGGKYDSALLGLKSLVKQDGTTHQRAVYTIDGHAGIIVVSAGTEWWVPLRRHQVKKHRSGTIYVDMMVPEHAVVPEGLVGAKVRLRANSTIKELEAGYSVAEHFRVFPEGDPVYRELYGLREDTESHNNKYKRHLESRRARTANPVRHRVDLAFWMLFENTRAAMAQAARLARASGPPLLRAA